VNYNPGIFKAYDIRGTYGQDFDVDFAFKLGVIFVKYLNRRKILVGRDNRSFSPELAESLMKGIILGGGDPQYLGLSSTPLFNFAFNKLGAEGGIMVTASHNPEGFGGFKLYDKEGNAIGLESGLETVKKMFENDGLESSKYGGKIIELNRAEVLDNFIKFILIRSKVKRDEFKNLNVNISGPEVAIEEANLLIPQIGLDLKKENADIIFGFDGDADRLMVYGKNNIQIKSDFILGLLVKDAVRFLLKPRVVYDLRFSHGVVSKFNEWGIKSFRSKVGRSFVKAEMMKHKADIGGELSGHVYFKEAFYNEVPLLTMLRVMKILAKSKMKIEEMVEPFATWANSGEINIPSRGYRSNNDLFMKLESNYPEGETDKLDGLSISYPDWRLNIRPSNTEPLIRLIVEAKTKDLLDAKVSELRAII
jgi:phosphomannomutase